MAYFRAWSAFDMRTFDFSAMYRDAFDVFFDPVPVVVEGKPYEGSFVLQSDELDIHGIAFHGNGLEYTLALPGFTGGRFHAFYRWALDETDDPIDGWYFSDIEGGWYFDIGFSGFDIAAEDLVAAMQTQRRADDRQLFAQMLEGDDRVTLRRGDDWFSGKAGHDTLNGGGGSDTLFGKSGLDILIGGAGDDLLYGGANADRMQGDAGNDTMAGGAGRDTMTGGEGADVFVLWSGAGGEVITDFTDGTDRIQFNNGPTGFDQLTITDLGTSVRIEHGREVVILFGVEPNVLSAEDFVFG